VWRRGVDVALTLQQLQANLDSINQAIGDKVSRVRFPDGRDVTYRSMDELLKAKGDIENQIRTYGGVSDSKSTLAQHRRGDGFPGPDFRGYW
jgi:hypothetical protein